MLKFAIVTTTDTWFCYLEMVFGRNPIDKRFVAFEKESQVVLFEEDSEGSERIGSALSTLTGHIGDIVEIALSPNEQWIVSASKDKTAKVWSVKEKNCVRTLTGHTG